MEYVSVLTGGPFTDHPACTHWALAALARIINDQVDDDTRAMLAHRAPALARYGPSTPAVAETVIAHATQAMIRFHRDRADVGTSLLWLWALHLGCRTYAAYPRSYRAIPHHSFRRTLALLHRFAQTPTGTDRAARSRYLLDVLDNTLDALDNRSGAVDKSGRRASPRHAPTVPHMPTHVHQLCVGACAPNNTIRLQILSIRRPNRCL
ncbi:MULTISPECIES: hypothetical protein [unclassified Pseudonocardia]|uniref:hypothetical protein n=1 Tax=unclassified Pseudonocardia TaxID=2619320 RepID=UPI000761EF0A|nr:MULTISPECIES: hypothetical protein [unclassified Pseudonocardia]